MELKRKMSPYVIILFSFILAIFIGSLLLILPISLKEGIKINYLDALFVSTSNVTITGLTPINIKETFNLFGYVVMVFLMQIGGLSVTTITFFVISLVGSKIGYKSRLLVKESINQDSMKGVITIVKRIVSLTLVVELIGIILFIFIFMLNDIPFIESLGYSVFHTVASYNNAGFDIFGSNSLMNYNSNIMFNIVTMLLIVLGGIGSIVIYDLIKKKSYKRLTFHSKIVLKMTGFLLLFGFLSFYILEKDATIIEAMFHSVTLRTAGFYSYDYSLVRQTTLLIMVIFMFIGAAPASNGGGVKVTTIYTIYKTSVGYIKDEEVTSHKRSIPLRYQKKAFLIIFMAFNFVILATLSISFFDRNINLTKILFEVISAFSNTGLSLNLTSSLGSVSKSIIIVIMIIGRVGVLTFINSIISREKKNKHITEFVDLEYII